VHAVAQIVHFDTDATREITAWTFGANSVLPRDISIHWASPVDDDFHARFTADSRSYRYTILNRASRPGLDAKRLSWQREPLDAEAMQSAANSLLGEHDFSSFRASECQANHPIRVLHRLSVVRVGERIIIDIEANGFLHHMVRNIAGALMAVGTGDQPIEWMQALLALKDRNQGSVTAPPNGLCFLQAHYPARFGIPSFVDSA